MARTRSIQLPPSMVEAGMGPVGEGLEMVVVLVWAVRIPVWLYSDL